MIELSKVRMTATTFLELPETNLPIELIDGEVIQMPSPFDYHQALVGSIFALLMGLVEGGSLRISPLDVHLDEYNVVQPDVFWVANDSNCMLRDGKYWYGAPDLVVEVLSEATALRDRREKFALYEQHGTQEYWLVNPVEHNVEIWELTEKKFTRFGIYGKGETFASPLLQKDVALTHLFA